MRPYVRPGFRPLVVVACLVIATGCGSDREPSLTRDTGPVTSAPTASSTAKPGRTPFDEEAWRDRAIARFGPEREFADGTKLDYVRVANEICALEERPDYEKDSIQEFIVETYCPNV